MAEEHVNTMDRISNLPECLLLQILSLLDLKDSCRNSSISRKFHRLCSINPVLFFDAVQFQTESFINFIDDTMRRYSDHNINIKKFKLKIEIDQYFACYLDGIGMINTWIGIAIGNQVEIIDLCIIPMDATEAPIPDVMVENLALRLPLLEDLMLYECYSLNCAKISSFCLKRFELKLCFELEKVDIDAPNLDLFRFSSKLYDKYPILSWSKCPAHCTTSIVQQHPQYIKMCYFTGLREFLIQSNMFCVLRLSLAMRNKVEFNAEDIMKISTEPPYKLGQLVLDIHNAINVESDISAMIEGLLWSCHPNTLTLEMGMTQATYLSANRNMHKTIMQKLSACALSRTHPLKGVEVKSIDWERLCEMAPSRSFMEFHFNLCW